MHPLLFSLGPIKIYSWGFMVAVAFVVGVLVAVMRAKKEGISEETTLDICVYVMISSIIGARLFYVIGFFDQFRSNIWSVFAFWEGGMVFYGGLIFAAGALFLAAKKNKLSPLKCLDIACLSAAIGYSIGRIGCFLRGCCYGLECSPPWGMHFSGVEGTVIPTQLYSAIAGIIIFTVLAHIYDRKKYDGQVFYWGLIVYSVYRFLIEFFRAYPSHYLGLTASQWISIAVFAAAIIAARMMRSSAAFSKSIK
ncbi:MAG: prolipoprotein diacylglyceryl transferase [Candidatus Margulisiibacteriota bacterium]